MKKSINRCAWVIPMTRCILRITIMNGGKPVYEDKKLFELLILEGAQAGLSWLTVLKKRENYRACFHQFEPAKIARYLEDDIRNRLKIQAAVANA